MSGRDETKMETGKRKRRVRDRRERERERQVVQTWKEKGGCLVGRDLSFLPFSRVDVPSKNLRSLSSESVMGTHKSVRSACLSISSSLRDEKPFPGDSLSLERGAPVGLLFTVFNPQLNQDTIVSYIDNHSNSWWNYTKKSWTKNLQLLQRVFFVHLTLNYSSNR